MQTIAAPSAPATRLLKAHPLADLFPLLEGAEFDELVADVRRNDVREPIVLHHGLILDGRNRYRAALAAGVECPTRAYDGDDPLGLVISLNLKRRHLNESQRAMVAAKLASLKDGQRADLVQGTPIGVAAERLNVGARSVDRAKVVREQGSPELIRAVEAGEVSVSGAVEQIRRGIVTGVAMHPHAERGLDLYQTPTAATRAVLAAEAEVLSGGTIWEPACGPGAIVGVLRAAGFRVVATDIEAYGCPDARGGVDFLSQTCAPPGVMAILTNPPFMHANEFVRRALELVPRVVMLLRLGFLEGQGRSDILDGGQLARVLVFRNRLPMMHRDGWAGPHASSAIGMAWFVWDRAHRGPAELRRISWSADEQAPAAGDGDDGIPAFLRRASA
jgi:hypothetical protein